jgi:DNA-binding transcriptional MocR family regulator
MKLYEQLANSIAQSIQEGVLGRGDKLPSVRQASESRGVSPATIFQAYYLLEARGLIAARERSGYFVTGGAISIPPAPAPTVESSPDSMQVDVSELVFEVLESNISNHVVPLGSAFPSPSLYTLDQLAKCICSAMQAVDTWSVMSNINRGDAELRRQIALRYMIGGLNVAAEEIIVTNGALEALNLCLMAVTRPGDTVLIESPTFFAALQSIERIGLRAVEVPSHPKDGIDPAALERAIIKHKPKACWIMTNFQNPLGSSMSDAHKKALVELVTKYQVPLIEDDVYSELYFGDERPLPAKAFDTEGLVMHCSSFSKCLAPGYRVGWVAPGQYLKAVERLKLTTTLATSLPAQVAIARYLQKGGYDKHLRNLRQTLLVNQIKFIEAIERYFPEGTCLTAPQGGYFLWVKLPDGVDSLQLHKLALADGIGIAPGPIFSAQRKFANYIRLNYGHSWNMRHEMSLNALGVLVKRLMSA